MKFIGQLTRGVSSGMFLLKNSTLKKKLSSNPIVVDFKLRVQQSANKIV